MNKVTNRPDAVWNIFKRVYRLLTVSERRKGVLMLFTVFLSSLTELLGLAAVVPVIGLAIEPETLQRYEPLRNAFEWSEGLGVDSQNQFLIFLAAGLVGVFLFKALVTFGLTLFQTRYAYGVAHRLSGEMWSYHFSQSLERMRSQETGQILAEIKNWPGGFANRFLVSSLQFVSEVIIISVIFLGLLWYAPVVLLSVAILLLLGMVIIRKLTNQRLHAYGNVNRKLGPRSISLVNNAVRGFLEVITFRAVQGVRKEYLDSTRILFRIGSNSAVLSAFPSKLYEVLAVMAVSGAIIISLMTDAGGGEFFELLSLMAISAYRVMPTMTRLNVTRMGWVSSMYILDTMENGVAGAAMVEKISGEMSLDGQAPGLELTNLTLGYEGLDKPVVGGLNYAFVAGNIHAVVGPSGSGKSTLVSAMLGLHHPDSGNIRAVKGDASWVLGEDVGVHGWLENIGYLSQNPFLFKGTIRDNFTFRVKGRTVDEALFLDIAKRLGLIEILGENPLDFELNEGGSNLSGGQQQRLALLRALQLDTPILMLDEATSALDHASRDVVFSLLRERADRGGMVIIITHDRELAGACDEVLKLD